MFIGHYGPAIGAAGHKIKLWHGFIAVQFLDILWAPFILLGIEKVRIVENFTASNHFDLHHMPYTHSLVAAVFWSIIAGGFYRLWKKEGAMIIALLVFSHWILDFITHKPDLELWFGGPKVGLALWDNMPLALASEFMLMAAGFAFYLTRTQRKPGAGFIAPTVLIAIMTALIGIGYFQGPPASDVEAAQVAFVAYVGLAAFAAWVDATRTAKSGAVDSS